MRKGKRFVEERGASGIRRRYLERKALRHYVWEKARDWFIVATASSAITLGLLQHFNNT